MEEINVLSVPLITLRGIVVYPKLVSHIDIGREKSLAAVEEAMDHNRLLMVVTQLRENDEEPGFDDIYHVGTLVKVQQMLRVPGGGVRILVDGICRAAINGFSERDGYMKAAVEEIPEYSIDSLEEEALRRVMYARFEDWLRRLKNADELSERLSTIDSPAVLADFVASQLPIRVLVKQQILEMTSVSERIRRVTGLLDIEADIARLEAEISQEVRTQMDKQQREYYLREKIRVIRGELGDKVDKESEVEELREKMRGLDLPKHVAKALAKEIDRLDQMPPMMAESAIIRTYIDWVMELPWTKESRDNKDLKVARDVLEKDHYGLEKVKERIIEYLAVRMLTHKAKGPILCLVGPPGTGKTSIARSIAKAMNKEYVRVSLGGIRDEAEIRGHRRTYIGSMPGRIITGLKQAGTKNPVFLLDEVDKLASDLRGDPSAALLEVLDPAQNDTFTDHFIDLPFDLSKVFWIMTANVVGNIPTPLLDRMEVIDFSSYTEDEKLQIAKKYLVPKQQRENGLTPQEARFSDSVLRHIIRDYTREAGVRALEKTIGAVCRKLAKKLLIEQTPDLSITVKRLPELLGPVKFLPMNRSKHDEVGLVTGLAWTQAGGEVLETEAVAVKGKGGLTLTGRLGEVMKESATAAVTYIRRRAAELELPEDFNTKTDLHIHLPEGAIPKDGPSAGITMATAIASALTGKAVRHDVAMTGEITLRGTVLPVGGIKEKVIAAHREGIKKVLLPEENKRDMVDVPLRVKEDMSFVFVHHMDQVLEQALVK
ncbi:endopeptidase La [Colibacter massiliensis]|uniref:endopeptidase La n=1 Tax=Colibacter massiliensis TaxID=1852379 RepID=UPI00094DFF7D|nr:endopeptidase La [Colibacter massiliensis]